MTVRVYLFNNIPCAKHPSWTLAVFAISERDARDYMLARHYTGAKLIKVQEHAGKVTADCGATTASAMAENRAIHD